MKKLIFFIACCCGPLVCSVAKEKRYIMLDMLDSLYQVKHYTLSAQELYGVDETIKLYNVFGEGLILFSMLPNFYGDANWSEVNIDTIREELFDEHGFRRTMSARLMSGNSGDKKTLRFGLIKSDNGRHYKSTHCLTEFFHLVSYSSIFNSPYGTVNTGQSPLTIREMAALYQDEPGFGKPGQRWFPLDVRLPWTYLPEWWLLQREYLSEVFEWQGEKAYRFWTFTDWRNHDGLNIHRGIDRFVYMPGKGIVGGSYDFYFLFEENWGFIDKGRARHNKTKEQLWENILDEKVMLATEGF